MPTSYSGIYIDASFSDITTDNNDVDVDLTFADSDNIGAYNIPIVYTSSAVTATAVNSPMVFTVESTVSGYENKIHEYYVVSSTVGDVKECVTVYYKPVIVSGTNNISMFYFIPDIFGAGNKNIITSYIGGESFNNFTDKLVTYWWFGTTSGIKDYEVDYVVQNVVEYINDISMYFTKGVSVSGSTDVVIDSDFSGWVSYNVPIDLYCGVVASGTLFSEITTISGGLYGLHSDIFSTILDLKSVSTDLYCCTIGLSSLNTEEEVISGYVNKIDQDIYCCDLTEKELLCDIDLFSLKISNFSLSIDEYSDADGNISVDITDDIYNVTISGCYLKVNDVVVSGTTTSITDGYRIYYDPIDDFLSFKGSTIVTVHGENDNSDVLERDFYLTFSYIVEYNNLNRIGWNFGHDNRVIVRMVAENNESCPVSTVDAYWFDIEGYKSENLGASIVCVGPYPGIQNLPVIISPQSTAFFYGKTFTVVLTCKDFAGNIMSPFEYEFKIEDQPN